MASLVTTTVNGSLTASSAVNGDYIASFTNTHASSWGTFIKGGADNGDYSLLIRNHGDTDLLAIKGDGAATFSGALTVGGNAAFGAGKQIQLTKVLAAADFDAIRIAYTGSWSNYQGQLAGIHVVNANNDSSTMGRFGFTYGSGGSIFTITDLYDGGFGLSGDVFTVHGDGRVRVVNGLLQMGNTTVIDASRNITGTSVTGTTATFTGDITINSTTHAYAIINSSATTTASWIYHKQGGNNRWLSGVEGSETRYQLYSNVTGSTGVKFALDTSGNGTFSGGLTATTGSFAGHVTPATNISYNLGSSSLRWLNIYGSAGNFSGTVTGAFNGTLGATTPSSVVGTVGTFNNSLTCSTASAIYGAFNSTQANGGYINFQRSGVVKGYIGSAAQLLTGGADDIELRSNARLALSAVGALELWAGEAKRVTVTSGGTLNVGSPNTSSSILSAYEATDHHNGANKPSSTINVGAWAQSTNEGPTIDFNIRWAGGYEATNTTTGWIGGRIGSVYDTSSSNGGALVFYTNHGTSASGGPNSSQVTEKVRIRPDGKVGIGISTPQNPLEVDLNQSNGTLTGDSAVHFGGPHHTTGQIMGITLGYRESNASYRKIGIVAAGLSDSEANQDFHILVNTVNSAASCSLTDKKLSIYGATGYIQVHNKFGIGVSPGAFHLNVNGAANISGALTVAGAVSPATNISYNLGSSSLRWLGIYGSTANFSGALTVSGGAAISGSGTYGALIRNTDTAGGYGLAVESEGTASTRYNLILRNLAGTVIYGGVSTTTGQVGYWGIGVTPTGTLHSRLTINGNASPYINNTYTLGDSTYRWANTYSVLGNFTGVLRVDTGINHNGTTILNSSRELINIAELAINAAAAGSNKLYCNGVSQFGGNLHIKADDAYLDIKEADGTAITYLGDHTGTGVGALFLYNHGGTQTIFLRADADDSYINTGGQFGIGNNAPQHLLHVGAALGTALNTAGSLLRNSNTTYTAIVGGSHNSTTYNETAVALKIFPNGGARGANKYSAGISFQHLDPNTYPAYDHGSHAAIALRYTNSASAEQSALTFLVNSTTTAGDQPTEKMCILPDGKVGVGTIAPPTLLSNTSTRIANADGLTVSTSGLNWALDAQGYVAALSNLATSDNHIGGLLVEIGGTGGTNKILDLESGGVNRVRVLGNGAATFSGSATFSGTGKAIDLTGSNPYVRVGSTVEANSLRLGWNNDTGYNYLLGQGAWPLRLGTNNSTRLTIASTGEATFTNQVQLNTSTNPYEGSLTFGSNATWRCGIRQHDDGHAELRIWAKNAAGHIFLATGYDGEPASIAKPTAGLVVAHNNVGIGNWSSSDPSSILHIKTSANHNYEFEEVAGELRLSALNDARSANIPLQFAASEFNFVTGSVGIGTTSPSGLFHVYESSTGEKNWYMENAGSGPGQLNIQGGSGRYLSLSRSSTVGAILVDGPFKIMNYSGGWNTSIYCEADGDVGIGTTAPGANLDSDSDEGWSGGWRNNLRLTSDYYPCIRFYSQTINKTSLIGNNNDGGLWFGVNGSGDAYSSYGMVIRADGNIGMGGITSPLGTLNLPLNNYATNPTLSFGDGDTGFYEQSDDVIIVSIGGGGRFEISSSRFGAVHHGGGVIMNEAPSVANPTIGPSTEDLDTGFGHDGTGNTNIMTAITAGSERMRWAADGNVGIGTISPECSLQVEKLTGGTDILLSAGNYGTSYGLISLDSASFGLASGNKVRALTILHSNQYVGINETTPTYQLDVNGTGRFTGQLTLGTGIIHGSTTILNSSRELMNIAELAINAAAAGSNKLYCNGNANINGDCDASTFTGSGAALTSLNASNISSGTVATARLGTGTASSTTYLAGNGTWSTPSGGGGGSGTVTSVSVGTGLDVSSATTTPNITLDFNELATAGTITGTDDLVVVDGTATRKEQVSTISLSAFSGYYGLINQIYKTAAGSSISPDSSGHVIMAEGTGVSLSYSGNTITFATGTSSDYRLKKNISNFNSNAWAKVKSVNLRKFDFDEDAFKIAIDSPDAEIVGVPKSYTDNVGFIAHELAEVGIEGSVIGEKDAVDADGNLLYQKINYIALVPALWGALNEAISKIETLESKVQALENK